MSRRFPNRPQSRLSADNDLAREGGRIQRLVFGERIIITRALCHYETMPTPAGGHSLQRYEAAKLSAKSRTPIADPAFYFDWGKDRIGIWSWPRHLTDDIADFEGETLPETVLHPPMLTGSRLVKCIDGYEGQVWRDRVLVASRWWPTTPNAADWAGFLRATRASEAVSTPPAPEVLDLLSKPTNTPPYTVLLDRIKSISLRDVAALLIVFLAAPTLYYLGQWAQLSHARASASAELAQLSQETAEISAARQNAQTASDELALYAQALNRRHPAALLASVSEELSRFSLRLDSFEQNEDRLTLVIQADEGFAPEALVRAMENNPLMNSVSVEPRRGSGEWSLTANLEAQS